MEQIFHVKYWDYTYDFCNLHGYICLGCSLTWGVCALLLTGLVHTPIEKLVLSLPAVPLMVIDIIFAVYFIWDMITSAQEAFDLKKIILEKGLEFNKSKEELTEEFQNRLQAARDRVDHRSQKMRKHATRILSRNPGSVSFKHKAEFESIKERINELRKTK